jgi:hypothetical protein
MCMRMLYRVHSAKEIKLYWWLSRTAAFYCKTGHVYVCFYVRLFYYILELFLECGILFFPHSFILIQMMARMPPSMETMYIFRIETK